LKSLEVYAEGDGTIDGPCHSNAMWRASRMKHEIGNPGS
jgi:hypothetical protein